MSKSTYYFGFHAVSAVLQNRPEDVQQLFVLNNRDDERIQEIMTLAEQFGVSAQMTKKQNLEKLANSHQHQGVVIKVRPVKTYTESDLPHLLQNHAAEHPPLFLVLDQITDPHNLGACMRSAAAMGVTAVIVSKRNSCSLTATAVKVSTGATEITPFVSSSNLVKALNILKDLEVQIVGTMLDKNAIDISQCDFSIPTALIMGAEDKGLRPVTQKACDQLCYLPMYGDIQSLNVSVATGMSLYEARRQIKQ